MTLGLSQRLFGRVLASFAAVALAWALGLLGVCLSWALIWGGLSVALWFGPVVLGRALLAVGGSTGGAVGLGRLWLASRSGLTAAGAGFGLCSTNAFLPLGTLTLASRTDLRLVPVGEGRCRSPWVDQWVGGLGNAWGGGAGKVCQIAAAGCETNSDDPGG